jgi:hypothetical protein
MAYIEYPCKLFCNPETDLDLDGTVVRSSSATIRHQNIQRLCDSIVSDIPRRKTEPDGSIYPAYTSFHKPVACTHLLGHSVGMHAVYSTCALTHLCTWLTSNPTVSGSSGESLSHSILIYPAPSS